MDRRAFLGGVAGGASLLAGCSTGGDGGTTPTVTPVAVPAGGSNPVNAAGELDPPAVGDAHVDALAGGSARVGVEYRAGRDEQPFDLARIVATVDGAAVTHRVYAIRELPSGAVTRTFRGRWHGDGAAVVRYAEEGGRSSHIETEGLTPPPAAKRFDRDRLVALLSAFDPSVTGDGEAVTAESVADPGRLPTPRGLDGSENGRLRGRLDVDGVLVELGALFAVPPARAGSDPAPITYRLAVTDRGETTVERPDTDRTLEWYRTLQTESPVPETAAEIRRPDW